MQCVGSYLELAELDGLGTMYFDLASNLLWLACSLIEFGAEARYSCLERGDSGGGPDCQKKE